MSLGYTSYKLVRNLIANSMMSKTSATTDAIGDVLSIGNSLDVNVVTNELVETFAQDASQSFDAAINGLYQVPLRKSSDFECRLFQIGSPTSGILVPSTAAILSPGDSVIVVDGAVREEAEVESVGAVSGGKLTVTLTAALANFNISLSSKARVVRYDYPAAAKFVVTRLTTANIFDKLFTAQADKQESDYGKFLRGMAIQSLNNILAGSTRLRGQRILAELTVAPSLIKPLFPQAGAREAYKIEDRGR